jgi:DNA-binding transcriptional ArsR family regulator
VSRHLKLLRGAGLVTEVARGTQRIYSLHDEGVEAVRRYLEEVWGSVATRFTIAAENTEERT